MATTTMRGVVKRLITDKGFGFIQAEGGRDEFFFHMSAVGGEGFAALQEGDAVTFQQGTGPKGPRAENVQAA